MSSSASPGSSRGSPASLAKSPRSLNFKPRSTFKGNRARPCRQVPDSGNVFFAGGWRDNKQPGPFGFAILDGTKHEITAETGFLAKHGLLLDDDDDRHYYEFCYSSQHDCHCALFRSEAHFDKAAALLKQECPGDHCHSPCTWPTACSWP